MAAALVAKSQRRTMSGQRIESGQMMSGALFGCRTGATPCKR